MKLVYLGTPDMAVPPLRALCADGHEVVLVVTRADKRRGRGGAVSPSPVKQAALDLGLEVSHDPDDVVAAVRDKGAELGVVVAFGRLIKPQVLDAVPMINAHFSLLPRWRGAAPVERAILAGDDLTGVDIMRVEEGLDTGGIYAERVVPIGDTVTAAELRSQLVDVASAMLVELLSEPVAAWIDTATPQQGDAVYAAKLSRDDFEIDWSQPGAQIDRLVRVGDAWTTFRDQRIKVLAGEVVDGEFVPRDVQPAGKRPMSFRDWRNGAQPGPHELFGKQ